MTDLPPTAPDDVQAIAELRDAFQDLRQELAKVIVGQEDAVEQIVLCILAGGHAILEGVPGLAKTLLVSSLARCLDLKFSRIQFTPDLMPADITGTEVIQEDKATGQRSLVFLPGPVFANVLLADEINRTPPKTQAALLEAMQERQVTVGGRRHPMPDPFFVLATQNPIEQEGTYPLPEAQQDRFMLKILIDYPDWEQEAEVVRRTTGDRPAEVRTVLTGERLQACQHLVRRVPAGDHVIGRALRIARSTRPGREEAPDFIGANLAWGAGPRAAQFLVLGAKARAALHGRHHATADDVDTLALPVLRHRIATNFNAEAEGLTPDLLIARLLETFPVGESALDRRPETRAILAS